jgi:hypothetical protein
LENGQPTNRPIPSRRKTPATLLREARARRKQDALALAQLIYDIYQEQKASGKVSGKE